MLISLIPYVGVKTSGPRRRTHRGSRSASAATHATAMLAVLKAPSPPPPLSIQAAADGLCLTTGPLRFTGCAGADLWAAEPLGSALRLQSGPVKLWQPLSADGEGPGRLCLDQRCFRCVHRGNGNLGKPGFCFKGHEEVRSTRSLARGWGVRAPRDTAASFLPSVSPTSPQPRAHVHPLALTRPPQHSPTRQRPLTRFAQVHSRRHNKGVRPRPQAPWRAWCLRRFSSARDSSGAKAPPSRVAEPRPRCAAQPHSPPSPVGVRVS